MPDGSTALMEDTAHSFQLALEARTPPWPTRRRRPCAALRRCNKAS